MMVTKEQAIWCQHFEHVRLTNRDGIPVRARANGACKLWKTRPDDFRLPVKHGLKECFYITPGNADEWTAVDADRAVHGELSKVVGLPASTPEGIVRDLAKERGLLPM